MPVVLDAQKPDISPFIKPEDTILWGQANAESLPLSRALMAGRHKVGGRFRVFLGINTSDTCQSAYADCLDFIGYGATGNNRALVKAGIFGIYPCHYSQLGTLLTEGSLKVDVLLLQLSPANSEGLYSLGLSHEYLVPVIDTARVVIAEINQQMPFVHGKRMLRMDDLDAVIYTDRPVPEMAQVPVRAADDAIARYISTLVDDGATLQLGIGAIAESVLKALHGHKNLGFHSGSMTDGVADLMAAGVINNRRKSIDRNITTAGVLLGTKRLYEFVADNPAIIMRSSDYTHNHTVLSAIDNLVAINSAIEVDLTGAVNSEVAAGHYVGAVGGALDFIRGAAEAKGGLPIIALPSMAGKHSKIVANLNGPTTIPRCDAGLVVTEFGIADLRGLSLNARREKMLAIAHPDMRAQLANSVSILSVYT